MSVISTDSNVATGRRFNTLQPVYGPKCSIESWILNHPTKQNNFYTGTERSVICVHALVCICCFGFEVYSFLFLNCFFVFEVGLYGKWTNVPGAGTPLLLVQLTASHIVPRTLVRDHRTKHRRHTTLWITGAICGGLWVLHSPDLTISFDDIWKLFNQFLLLRAADALEGGQQSDNLKQHNFKTLYLKNDNINKVVA